MGFSLQCGKERTTYGALPVHEKRHSNLIWWDLTEWLERLTVNAVVATVLGSIPASSEESEGRRMKQCWISYISWFNIPARGWPCLGRTGLVSPCSAWAASPPGTRGGRSGPQQIVSSYHWGIFNVLVTKNRGGEQRGCRHCTTYIWIQAHCRKQCCGSAIISFGSGSINTEVRIRIQEVH